MNEAIKMQISAFVDGELPDNESELLLRRLSQDATLRGQVAEYLEIGRLLRNDRSHPGIDGLRSHVSRALGDASVADAPHEEVVGSRLMTPATGVAVAATVAAVALLGLSQLSGQMEPDLEGAVAIVDGEATYTEPSVQDVLSDRPSEQILEYYRRHDMSSDDFAHMVNLELREDEVVEIEPDPHLIPSADSPATNSQSVDDKQNENL